jgi:nicotinate-nucleotide adenylyltransferase
MMRLGLFGGTFDPIHCGHLDVARAARTAVDLSAVWVIPSRVPPHRRTPHASAAHRFAMVAAACAGDPYLLASDLEMEDPSPSFTTSTLDRLAARGVDTTKLFFITGADAFRDIGTWKSYPQILDRCHFVVVSRPGQPALALRELLPDLASRMIERPSQPPIGPAVVLVDAPTAPVSSTEVRERARAGKSVDGLVPPAVAAYIGKHGLYGSPKDEE